MCSAWYIMGSRNGSIVNLIFYKNFKSYFSAGCISLHSRHTLLKIEVLNPFLENVEKFVLDIRYEAFLHKIQTTPMGSGRGEILTHPLGQSQCRRDTCLGLSPE